MRDRSSLRSIRLHGRRASAKPVAALYRPGIERLEDRCTPATVTYTNATSVLQFLADAGQADDVTITAPAANTVQILVGNADDIVLAGDAVANANFVLSTTVNPNDTLTINSGAAALANFGIQLGDQGDALAFSLANTPNGVSVVNIDAEGGDDTLQFGTTTTGGGLTAVAENISFSANAAITAVTGDISLTTTDTAAAGQDIVLASGVSVQASAGSVTLRSGDNVQLQDGSTVHAGTSIDVLGDFNDQDAGTGATIELHGALTATSVTATGGSDADSFDIRPSIATAISAVGGFPGVTPGDALVFDLAGAADPFLQVSFVSGDSRDGNATFSNRQAVSFVSMETLPATDIAVAANDNPDPVQVGSQLTLSVTVTNSGTLGLKDINVVDTMPAGLSNTAWTAVFNGTGSTGSTSGTGNINETVDLAGNGSVTYTITGTVVLNASSPISNTAVANAPAGIVDSNTANNTATTDTTVAQGSDLQVTVTDAPDPIQVAGTLTYIVTITNQGPADATGVVVTNTLPVSATFQSAVPGQGTFTQNGNVVTWNAGNLANLASAALTIVAKPTTSGTITNTAVVAGQQGDVDPSDNTATTSTTVTALPSIVVVGAGVGNTPTVQVFDGASNAVKFTFDAYATAFRGGVRVATGDMNGDGVQDIITAAGPGGGPHVRVFNGIDGAPLAGPLSSFYAYESSFAGGVSVATGDVNNDGKTDIITGAGFGGGPHVRVFSGATGAVLHSFFAYSEDFLGGVVVAAGDIDNDGRDDIITGAGAGGGPHVMVYSGANRAILRSFFAYTSSFTGGVLVAAGDINGDNRADIITGAGASGGPHVRAFSGIDNSELLGFMALNPTFNGGVTVAVVDSDNDGQMDIVTGPGTKGDRVVRILNGATLAQISAFEAFDATFLGGIFVGGG